MARGEIGSERWERCGLARQQALVICAAGLPWVCVSGRGRRRGSKVVECHSTQHRLFLLLRSVTGRRRGATCSCKANVPRVLYNLNPDDPCVL